MAAPPVHLHQTEHRLATGRGQPRLAQEQLLCLVQVAHLHVHVAQQDPCRAHAAVACRQAARDLQGEARVAGGQIEARQLQARGERRRRLGALFEKSNGLLEAAFSLQRLGAPVLDSGQVFHLQGVQTGQRVAEGLPAQQEAHCSFSQVGVQRWELARLHAKPLKQRSGHNQRKEMERGFARINADFRNSENGAPTNIS